MKDISRSEAELTLAASFILLINFLAVTGNFMVCLAVYRNRSLLTVPFLYVLALAISDFLVALLCFPFCVSAAIQGRWVFGHLFCQFNGFILYCWAAVSVFVLALTAINRFYRVCKPNTYRRIFTMKNSLFVIVSACVLPVGGGLIATHVHRPSDLQVQPWPLLLCCLLQRQEHGKINRFDTPCGPRFTPHDCHYILLL